MKRKIYFLPSCFVLLSNLLFAQKNEEILKNYFNNSAKYRSLNSANKQFAIKTSGLEEFISKNSNITLDESLQKLKEDVKNIL